MNESARLWLDLAKQDLAASLKLLDDATFSIIVSFLAAQCIEKSINALQGDRDASPVPSDDLADRYAAVSDRVAVPGDGDITEDLRRLAAHARLQTTIRGLPAGRPSRMDAQRHVALAGTLYDAVCAVLGA